MPPYFSTICWLRRDLRLPRVVEAGLRARQADDLDWAATTRVEVQTVVHHAELKRSSAMG
jgi:hypothetical protein